MSVTETQNLTTGGVTKEAVKSVDVAVGQEFGEGFFGSCKDVKFGATNGFAMDLLGGGAKNFLAFLRYMGQERALGSPFQINFPSPSAPPPARQLALSSSPSFDNSTVVPFHDSPLSCSSPELNARCACPDCPSVCASLPPIASPAELASHKCKVGKMSCFSFALTIIYAVALVGFVVGVAIQEALNRKGKKSAGGLLAAWQNRMSWQWSSRDGSGYDRVPMEDPLLAGDLDDSATPIGNVAGALSSRTTPSSGTNSLVGATSTSQIYDGEDVRGRRPPSGSSGITSSNSPDTSRHRLSRGASLLDPSSDPTENPFLQPRTYPLNTFLSTAFYKLGLFCARRPYLTLAAGFAFCGIVNLGWGRFEVEKDPVKLWVAKGSESERAKNDFDESFGPFYRTEQIFVSVAPAARKTAADENSELVADRWEPVDEPVLTWERLQWWASVEAAIRDLKSSPNNYTLADVCFSPQTDPLPPSDASAYRLFLRLM